MQKDKPVKRKIALYVSKVLFIKYLNYNSCYDWKTYTYF